MSLRVERYVEDFNPRERMLVANRFNKLGTLFHTSALGIRQGEMCDRPICHLHPFPRISKPPRFCLFRSRSAATKPDSVDLPAPLPPSMATSNGPGCLISLVPIA